MMLEILTAILAASSAQHVDPYLVAAVIQVESKFDSKTVGSLGEIGLMQLRPEYFSSDRPADLFNPKVNIALGVKYLKQAELRCKHKQDHTFLVCYNAGIKGGSRISNPREFNYYRLVSKAYQDMLSVDIFKGSKEYLAYSFMNQEAFKNFKSVFSWTPSLIGKSEVNLGALGGKGLHRLDIMLQILSSRRKKMFASSKRLFSGLLFGYV